MIMNTCGTFAVTCNFHRSKSSCNISVVSAVESAFVGISLAIVAANGVINQRANLFEAHHHTECKSEDNNNYIKKTIFLITLK